MLASGPLAALQVGIVGPPREAFSARPALLVYRRSAKQGPLDSRG